MSLTIYLISNIIKQTQHLVSNMQAMINIVEQRTSYRNEIESLTAEINSFEINSFGLKIESWQLMELCENRTIYMCIREYVKYIREKREHVMNYFKLDIDTTDYSELTDYKKITRIYENLIDINKKYKRFEQNDQNKQDVLEELEDIFLLYLLNVLNNCINTDEFNILVIKRGDISEKIVSNIEQLSKRLLSELTAKNRERIDITSLIKKVGFNKPKPDANTNLRQDR
jgi:hypothetical protein